MEEEKPSHEARYPLAYDGSGNPIDVPAEAVAWRVRRGGRKRGRPSHIFDPETGRQLEIPLAATLDSLVEAGCVADRYLLYPVDALGHVIAGVIAVTEVLDGADEDDGGASLGTVDSGAMVGVIAHQQATIKEQQITIREITQTFNVGVPTPTPSASVASPGPSSAPSPAPSSASSASASVAPFSVAPSAPPLSVPVPVASTNMAMSAVDPRLMIPIVAAPPPSDVIAQAYSYNPRLRARVPREQEKLLEDMLGEQITMKMLSTLAAPVAFVVPDGCNTVEFFAGAIEANPNVGEASDLELVVTPGAFRFSDNVILGELRSGDQISVIVPWRYASWVELAPEHLRIPLTARFFSVQT